jgi:hypothetical protein
MKDKSQFRDNNNVVTNDKKSSKKIRGSRKKNKLSDMETYSQNKWDEMVDKLFLDKSR